MSTPSRHPFSIHLPWRPQRGLVIVEFALVALLIFFPLLLGIMEFGRWLFTLNAAAEATRLGARLAVVCSVSSKDADAIKNRMIFFVGGLLPEQITINYSPSNGCDPDWSAEVSNRCESVTVQILGTAKFTPLIPYFGVPVSIPPFTTTLTREFMNSASNPVCP